MECSRFVPAFLAELRLVLDLLLGNGLGEFDGAKAGASSRTAQLVGYESF